MIWESLWLTLKLASITTLLLFIIGTPLAYWLSATKSKTKPIWETLVSMPLILPPTVLGFYLLIAFGQSSFLGKFLEDVFGLQLVFSFSGLVLASFIYSLPFMVHPIQSGFSSLPVYLKEAAYSLGKSKTTTFFKILIPNIKPALLTGIVLSFAHTIGEFGVVLMIGGNLPGETRVASIAIYDEVEALNYSNANTLSLILFVLSFCILLCVYLINNKSLNRVVK
ncbi:MAG: molybdate ABC transporter permease subunit [Zunongwangia sp.]|jgi:molybdate transport system permease protein|uniref:Molybdenum transport system permease n=1 Tax=Zunongwangia profunda TaxID=398743 RepID=A0A3D5J7I8_9FLAO|nr:molybdate ABC transporter permease subunit [Zunongwangia profunda]MAC66169.1 molybdate ABC transporter permease subunit [Flavobacteriaceae bacterium]MAO38580.1 molybdate ABC transporter permease subunit [Zunongwangia sp.]MAG87687.1 molybdate ABC transporter permease subunit [Flavobacteriaceae bacterium]MAS70863.1 molybdate ABC transporter permease subunit [Zunongwangia sp.]MCC4230752.1 molybdate ABC transporter permease subunit [Zunongwangia profunda]|tara:strand:+ start:506 stop:1177 length:672 start_codon:yes stop_codon:yes gene_type:complete